MIKTLVLILSVLCAPFAQGQLLKGPGYLASLQQSAPPASSCPSGLAHSWKGNNSLADSAGAAPLGGEFSTGVTYASGKIANGFSFDGSSFVRLDAADSAGLSMGAGIAKSVSFWVKLNAMNSFTHLLNKGDYGGGNEEYDCYLNSSSNIVFRVYDSGGTAQPVISTVQLEGGTTNHVAFTYDGAGNAKLYVNGTVTTETISDGRDTAAILFLGMDSGGNNKPNGVIDELQIYTRELTAGEVSTLYAGGAGKSCP